MVARKSNKRALRHALEAHAKGEVGPMRAILGEDFVSEIHAPKKLFRMGGERKGFANAIVTLSQVSADYTIHQHDIHELAEDGEIVWVRGVLDVTSHKTSKRAAFAIASRWQFREGKARLAEWYFDSAAVAAHLGLVRI